MEITISSATLAGTLHGENEDCIVYMKVNPYNDVMLNIGIVCDGMGGMSNGKISACAAAEVFASSFIQKTIRHYETEKNGFSILNYRDRIIEAMIYALESANGAVCETATPGFGSGTTLSAVIIADDFLTAVNVGDSPIYYYNSISQKVSMISRIHNRSAEESEQDKYEGGRILTHYLGEYRKLSDELLKVCTVEKMTAGDKILIMSDGFGILDEHEIENIVSISDNKEAIVSKVMSYSGMYDDDKSVILMEML